MHHAATWQRKEEERCWDGYTGELGTTSKLRQSSVWPGRNGYVEGSPPYGQVGVVPAREIESGIWRPIKVSRGAKPWRA